MKNFNINEVGNNMLNIYNKWIHGLKVIEDCISLKEMVIILLSDLDNGILHGSEDDIDTLKNMLLALDLIENAPADENVCVNDVSGFITDMLDRMNMIREDVAEKFLKDFNKILRKDEGNPYIFIAKIVVEKIQIPVIH
ncbi:hypothetical protein [Clostridium tarantellae]|uniref:Uncharacterized protein n=1 Tax=Clostridium tarantellae TaxID=39493 RepID=A0A6I1MNM8_9CLOT|nr:hypothetical protein [Clostridium tarantellae]MPQ45106.1 hypothetical protein [Clostridium tarantellae]